MATYTELIQSRLTYEQFKMVVLYCHKNKISVTVLMRKLLGMLIEGKEW